MRIELAPPSPNLTASFQGCRSPFPLQRSDTRCPRVRARQALITTKQVEETCCRKLTMQMHILLHKSYLALLLRHHSGPLRGGGALMVRTQRHLTRAYRMLTTRMIQRGGRGRSVNYANLIPRFAASNRFSVSTRSLRADRRRRRHPLHPPVGLLPTLELASSCSTPSVQRTLFKASLSGTRQICRPCEGSMECGPATTSSAGNSCGCHWTAAMSLPRGQMQRSDFKRPMAR